MFAKNAWLWMQRAAIAVSILAYLARLVRLPFAPTLMMGGLASFAAVAFLGLGIELLHRWNWVSQLPREDKQRTGVASALVDDLPAIVEPAPIASTRNPNPASVNRGLARWPVTATWTKVLRPTACVLASAEAEVGHDGFLWRTWIDSGSLAPTAALLDTNKHLRLDTHGRGA
jgi:hypothetical protein